MAHLSLYRKYRPQSFADVVGQQHVTQTLQTAIKQDRLAHALLFSGPRGTGKTSTARILAKALNCERGGDEPCGECSSCVQIVSGSSLDVVEIDAASHGSVDDARDLREKVAYSSVSGRWKVYIIDECHMLSPAANNALLKVLEEPPEHVVFVFATTEPHKVLQTVLDRCQRYEFRSIGSLDTAGRIAQICELEGISADPEAITLISSRAGGSMRDALSLLDQLRSFAGNTVSVGDLAQLLGRMPDDVLFEAVDLISERDIGAVFVFAERLIRSGVDIREFARALTDHLRSLLLVLHAPAAREILEVTDDGLTRLQEQANHLGSAEVLRLIDLTNEIGLQLRQAVEGRLALEVGLARMTRPDLHATPASLLARLDRLERAQASGAPAAPAAPPGPRSAEGRPPPPGIAAGSRLAPPRQASPGAAPPVKPAAPVRPAASMKPPTPVKPAAPARPAAPAAPPPAAAAPKAVPETEVGGWDWESEPEEAPAAPRAAGSPSLPPKLPPDPAQPVAAPAPAPIRAAGTLRQLPTPVPDGPAQESPTPVPDGPAQESPTPVPDGPAPETPAPVPDGPAQESPAVSDGAAPQAAAPVSPAPYGVPAATAPEAAAAAPATTPGELDLDTIVRAWPVIRDKVKRRKISFHAVLLPAEPVGWDNGELVLEFGPRSRFHRDKVADPSQHGPLLEAFAEVLGVTPRVKCVMGTEPPPAKAPVDPAGAPPDDAGPSEMEGTEPPEDAIELIRRAFKGTVVVEDP